MQLLEYQAKQILEKFEIPVPRGMLITSGAELQLASLPTVLKAQVPTGGRGKAGAIRFANGREKAQKELTDLLQSEVKGYPIQAVLSEDLIKAEQEIYLACYIDKRTNSHAIMACSAGGVDIEEVAKTRPEKIISTQINPVIGIEDYMVRSLTKSLRIEDRSEFSKIVKSIYSIAIEMDAFLVEINPLANSKEGLIALDAKIVIDDKADYRQKEFLQKMKSVIKKFDCQPKTASQLLAETIGLNYVALDGDIGLIADGAGTGMLTMDLVYDAGGRPANFCEMGGLAGTEIMERTIEAVLADERVKALLISLIGGLTRMDEMAGGIVKYLERNGRTVPIVVRMCGTKADVGIPMLRSAGIESYEDLMPAVEAAVGIAGTRDNGYPHQ